MHLRRLKPRSTKARDDEEEEKADQDDADERNVFYVALTRARKEVFVTRSQTDREGKEILSSKFIQELKPEILAPLDVSAYEADFASRRGEIEFSAGTQAAGVGAGGETRVRRRTNCPSSKTSNS